ncbi:LAME_0A06040g1_1 [Lachancea meyersii CBS 8951]|uniref:LAME_0A06040g1_1 n=1 Tax=Lachancea meyersii CBS 8951 TaxID=1266667 RepID=A0A1G4IQ12_9SACH|nr:LAME_0A06040g1_1 [Lachancea meyersii CBS 8951]
MNLMRPLFVQKLTAMQLKKLGTTPMRFMSTRPFYKPMGVPTMLLPRIAGFAGLTALALSLQHFSSNNAIRNDTILDVKQRHQTLPDEVGVPVRTVESKVRKLNYRQLCLGSIIGLVAGVVVGKISTVLVFLTAFGLLSVQWLENRGLVDKRSTWGLSKYVLRTGKESVDLNTLIWEKPNFKIPFLLTFVLAAVNI